MRLGSYAGRLLNRTGDTGDGLLARKIGNVDKGIVEGRENVGDTEDKLALSNLGTERDGVLLLLNLDFFGGLQHLQVSFPIHRFSTNFATESWIDHHSCSNTRDSTHHLDEFGGGSLRMTRRTTSRQLDGRVSDLSASEHNIAK